MQAKVDIACVGNAVMDIVVRYAHDIPPPDAARHVEGISARLGGCAANTAMAVSRVGARAALVSRLGRDHPGAAILETLRAAGVETATVVLDDEAHTPQCVAFVRESGERSFLVYNGCAANLAPDDVMWDALTDAKVLFISPAFYLPKLDQGGSVELFEEAKSRGMVTALDVAGGSKAGRLGVLEPILRVTDVFIPSEQEAYAMSGLTTREGVLESFERYGLRIFGMKLGADGVVLRHAGGEIRRQAHRVPVRDTIGAGDVFMGAFLTAYAVNGWGIGGCVDFAQACAALKVSRDWDWDRAVAEQLMARRG